MSTAVRGLTEPGDAVLIQTPVYYPFAASIERNGRKVVRNSLCCKDGKYVVDFDDFENKIRENNVKLFILCSPHNPVGRVWKREELIRMGEICRACGVIVVSDEIHCDFTYAGYTHHIFASLGEAFADHSVICTAPSKTFNLAGLQISNAICNLLNVVFISLGSAVGILSGQTLGAGEYDKAKKNAYSLMKFAGVICVGLTILLVSISGVFPNLYDTTSQVRNYGTWFIIITALFFPVQGVLNALYFTVRSGGKTFITFLFDSVYSWVVPLPIAAVLCYYTGLPILGIYAIVQAADLIKLAVGYILIQKGVWISNIVED